ncbi:MAG: YbaB/EbfC family nucleoid-associated protein, partial [Planctomycetota bacterium]
MFGMEEMMRQVQNLQTKIRRLQKDLEERVYEGTSGGGVVKAFVNGKKMLLKIEISKEVVGDDVGMLEDMVVAAVEEAQRKADEAAKEEMRRITGSL